VSKQFLKFSGVPSPRDILSYDCKNRERISLDFLEGSIHVHSHGTAEETWKHILPHILGKLYEGCQEEVRLMFVLCLVFISCVPELG
jgi:hypothetical protein